MSDSREVNRRDAASRPWFEYAPGRHLIALEQARIGRVLPDLFGYHIVQVGSLGVPGFLDASRISHKIVLQIPEGTGTGTGSRESLICSSEALPFAPDSIDVVVLPHVLEFAPNPHRVLREVERVLIGEGHLVLLGFNPWSLWGLWRLALAWREDRPWCGHYYPLARLRDWLSLLDFDVVSVDRLFFRPPLHNPAIMGRLEVLEKLGRYALPLCAGVYLVVAKKRIVPLTPSRLQWRARRGMIAAGIAEPSVREYLTE